MGTARLADALYAEEVSRARAMTPADKLLEGPRLFERACRLSSRDLEEPAGTTLLGPIAIEATRGNDSRPTR
jgi:hypothetical protein